MSADLPVRCRLPHTPPPWVAAGSRFFITINALPRGGNPLLDKNRAVSLLDGICTYHERGIWYAALALVMPDHLHAVLAFKPDKPMTAVVADWKRYQARQLGITWQAGFFDHRLRNEQQETEKMAYIRLNPVRKMLVERAEEWPYIWTP